MFFNIESWNFQHLFKTEFCETSENFNSFSSFRQFLFFNIESWNFQHLFKTEFCETSENFNSFSSFRQSLFSFFLSVVWLSWNFVRFHGYFFFGVCCLNFQWRFWLYRLLLSHVLYRKIPQRANRASRRDRVMILNLGLFFNVISRYFVLNLVLCFESEL